MQVFLAPDGTQYDMDLITEAESRLHEIAIVNAVKAPELMGLFARACFQLGRHIPNIYAGYQRAQRDASTRKAILIIDVIPGQIKEKGLPQNETTRQALLDRDPDYCTAMQKQDEFEAAVMLFKQKLAHMESALSVVKKIYGETLASSFRPNYNQNNVSFKEDEQSPDPQPAANPTPTATGFKIGKARY